jgi:hypothetical protein
MTEQHTRLRRKGLIARVGELLVDGHANCLEELGALVIVDSRINEFFYGLKRGTVDVKPGKSVRDLDNEYRVLYETQGAAFQRVSAEFLAADWPKARPDIWEAHQAKLLQAVTAIREPLENLLVEYVP